jgi:hypothetical protein
MRRLDYAICEFISNISWFSFLKLLCSPQSRRGRREENFSLAGERPAIEKLRYPPGNNWPEASAGLNNPASHGIVQIKSLCVLCVSAVKKISNMFG